MLKMAVLSHQLRGTSPLQGWQGTQPFASSGSQRGGCKQMQERPDSSATIHRRTQPGSHTQSGRHSPQAGVAQVQIEQVGRVEGPA